MGQCLGLDPCGSWMGLRLFNSVCLWLLLGSHGLSFITEIAFSSEEKVTENCRFF